MRILCPHCNNPIETDAPAPEEELCTSCESTVPFDGKATSVWAPRDDKDRVGKFVLLDRVGAGAFGTVYKARDPDLDRVVAVKVPRAGNLAGGEERDRFLREARSVAQLRHPGIVPVYEVGEHEGLPYLVSAFMPGVTLADRLTADRPPPRDAARLVGAVARALQYAHDHGVIHRDVKPSNIMMGEDGAPHLMDFGLAKRDTGEVTMTLEGQVLGTPAYMSPEQARGEGHAVDGRSDVYSLGVILYELLTGELPFRGNPRMLMHQVLHDEPRSPRSLNDRIPRDLETVCLKAMAKEPPRRYPSATALADDLDRYLTDRPVLARPPGVWVRLAKFTRRHRALVAGTTATFLALVLGIVATGLALVQARQEGERAHRAEAELGDELENTRRERARALSAERARRAELARTHAHAAQAALQRGQWQEALAHYQGALDHGHEDEIGMRLGRLQCWMARYQYKPIAAELAVLAKRTDLGKYEGRVRLWQADLALYQKLPPGTLTDLLREAIAKGLPPADEAFARACLAKTCPEATRWLQEAIARDRYHHRSYNLLLSLLLIQGRRSEAWAFLIQARALLPDSSAVMACEATLSAMEGNLDAANKTLVRLEAASGKEMTAVCRTAVKLFYLLSQEDFWWHPDRPARALPLVPEFMAQANRLARAVGDGKAGEVRAWADFQFTQLAFFRDVAALPLVKNTNSLELVRLALNPATAAHLLGRITERIPEGSMYYLQGRLLKEVGSLAEAEQALRQALALPAFMNCRRKALYELIEVQWRRAAKAEPALAKELKAQALANVRILAASGPLPVAVAYAMPVKIAWASKDYVLALTLLDSWQRQAPDDLTLLSWRLLCERSMGADHRAVATADKILGMKDKKALAPLGGESVILHTRLQAEYATGEYRRALATAAEILRADPKDALALTVKRKVRDRVKELRNLAVDP